MKFVIVIYIIFHDLILLHVPVLTHIKFSKMKRHLHVPYFQN